jgi:hypothetical protein
VPTASQTTPPPVTAAGADASATLATRATYQIFMVLVTLLALSIAAVYYLLPLPESILQVLYILDSLITVILLFDFVVHAFAARGRVR